MALSHQRHRVIDLTTEPDSGDEETTRVPLPGARPQPDAARVPLPPALSKPTTTPVTTAQSHTTIRSPEPVGAASIARSLTSGHGAANNSAHSGHGYCDAPSQRAAKRVRYSLAASRPTSHSPPPPPSTISNPSGSAAATPAYSRERAVKSTTRSQQNTKPVRATHSAPMPTNSSNKIPSVRNINQALNSNSSRIPLLDHFITNAARTLQIGRIPQPIANIGEANLASPVIQDAVHTESPVDPPPHGPVRLDHDPEADTPQLTVPTRVSPIASGPARLQTTMPDGLSNSRASVIDDNESIMSEGHFPDEPQSRETLRLSEDGTAIGGSRLGSSLPTAVPPNHSSQSTSKRKFARQFTEEQNHYLIFLKEVKAYSWKMVTSEFNAVFPTRAYPTLQTHYSSVLNKRDRSQDPATLSLPSQFASEAAVDWATVCAANPAPRVQSGIEDLHKIAAPGKPEVRRRRPQEDSVPQIFPIRQAQDHGYSSGGDSAPRRERSSRAARVNYTWPRQRRRGDDTEMNDAVSEDYAILDYENGEPLIPVDDEDIWPKTAITFDMEPSRVDFEAADAKLASEIANGTLQTSITMLPYLSVAQIAAMKIIAFDFAQNPTHRQSFQDPPWHVDFSPNEIDLVEESILRVRGTMGSRHSTRRRRLREILRDVTEAGILRLSHDLCRTLQGRDAKSIEAFLQDAKAGVIADVPRVQRLTTSRPDDRWSTRQSTSATSIIRDRESGRQSRRGWRAASKPLTYQLRNQVMDTFGTASSWIGASGDIHAVAWAPNGEMFAAAAVAVDDPHSMQYNRPNNLLFGDCSSDALHELGEHYREREVTEHGPNSTHAMFASQDPKIYNTVSSLGFSNSGNLLYSAGYDGSICVWHTDTEDPQPILGAKLNVKAPVDQIAINPVHDGVLAAAAKVANSKAVRLLQLNEHGPNEFERQNLHSSKAVSRPDLKILPTAIQFEPRFGTVLLAGFGANIRDFGFDITGDVCLWNVETLQPLSIYGASHNVFDVEFNPNPSVTPLFAVGCVAGYNANRGSRSIVRLYDVRADNRYGCATEMECKALDINDVVWCPYDEYLVAAGCTDGRAYIWDVRYEMDPLHVLSHGKSVMPLQDGIKYEYTDTGVRFLSWGDNATRLYSGSSDGVVKVWDVTRSKEDTYVKNIINVDSGIMAGAFSPDHSKLIIGEVNGSVNFLEVGRDGCSPADAPKLRYVPYEHSDEKAGDGTYMGAVPDSGIAEGHRLLSTGHLQVVPMGSLPVRQVVQGPTYNGPYDQSAEASILREKALEFQGDMANTPASQCILPACKDSINKITNEDIGDSGRGLDRIPDSLSRAWTSSELTRIVPGKSKCTRCGRPARPSWDNAKEDATVLCERCCFACFRCGSANFMGPGATSLCCNACAATWDIGTLGYETTREPQHAMPALDVPALKAFGKAAYLDRLADIDASFGDEMNALSDYYFSLAIDRPESPPL